MVDRGSRDLTADFV